MRLEPVIRRRGSRTVAVSMVGLALVVSLVVWTGLASATVTVTVGPNVNITKRVGNEAEGTIAVNPANPLQLFAASNVDDVGSTDFFSIDGGSTWTASTFTEPVTHCCDNVADFDTFGNLFLTNMNIPGFDPGATVQLLLSTDGGATFTGPITIDSKSGAMVDQPSLDTGANSVWVTWNDDATIKARGASVTGLGAVGAFSAEQPAPGSAGCAACQTGGAWGDIAVGPSGQVTVTYEIRQDGLIYVNTDADGLGSGGFGEQVFVTDTNIIQLEPIPAQETRLIDAEANLAYDRSGGPHNGRLYLVYTREETPDTPFDTNIFVRFSADSGGTWSDPVRVNDDATKTSQFNPAIVVDQTTGVVAVTWHDARNDLINNNTQLFGAVSDDGGAAWWPNFQISTGTSNDELAATSFYEYGDYTWNAFTGGNLYPIWADNSNSTGDNPDGATTFDMYTARIKVASPVPPDCSTASASPSRLWPPKLKFVEITVSGATDPEGGSVRIAITGVTQDEPTGGSPDASPGSAPNTVNVRSERDRNGDGRVYRITFTGTDDEGATCSGTVKVGVPPSKDATAVDSAPPSYDSFLP